MRLLLRKIYASAQQSHVTLEAALLAFGTARIEQTETGQTLRGASEGGHSVQYADTVGGSIDPVVLAEVSEELLTLYSEAKCALHSAGIASPSDADIRDEMLDRLYPVRSTYADASCIREVW